MSLLAILCLISSLVKIFLDALPSFSSYGIENHHFLVHNASRDLILAVPALHALE